MAEESGVSPESIRLALQEKIQASHVDIEDMSGTTLLPLLRDGLTVLTDL